MPIVSDTMERVRDLVIRGEVRVSRHGGAELRADGINLEDVLHGAATATVVEDYADAFKGPSVLALQHLGDSPVHVVWGLANGTTTPAVLVTVYRPDPLRWSSDFLARRHP